MNYPDSVRFLYSLGNEVKTAKLGLDRVRRLAEALDHPEQALKILHVAGTNGKGSVSAMLEAGLRAAGYRTGLYTSPHLVEPTERIRIDGEPVTLDEFARAFDQVHAAAEHLIEQGALDLHPTYFETVTLMALLLFRRHQVDWAVLEVGLGGRLDATNIVTPELTVITPIDFDHEALLGTSLEAIAGEKAGILKPGVPAIFSPQRPEAAAELARRAAEIGAPVHSLAAWRTEPGPRSPFGGELRVLAPIPMRLTCPLAGAHQLDNALTAARALHALGISSPAIEGGIAQVRWPGRLECVSRNPFILLDGAHNPAGARALAAYIGEHFAGRRIWMVYGAMRDKAVEEIAGILFPLAHKLVLTAPSQARALRPEALAALAARPDAILAQNVAEAIALVRAQAAPEDAVFFTGSLFLVGEARPMLVK